jgi:hypothetical protein
VLSEKKYKKHSTVLHDFGKILEKTRDDIAADMVKKF